MYRFFMVILIGIGVLGTVVKVLLSLILLLITLNDVIFCLSKKSLLPQLRYE